MAGFITAYQSVVRPAHCDVLGHMNVQYYFAALGDAMFAIQTRLGIGARQMREGPLSFVTVRTEADFLAELFPGDTIHIESGISEMSGKTGEFLHRMSRLEDGKTVMRARFVTVMMDLGKRQTCEIPNAVLTRARDFMVEPGAAGFAG